MENIFMVFNTPYCTGRKPANSLKTYTTLTTQTIREGFQTKKKGNFLPGPDRVGEGGGCLKNKIVLSISWEKFKIRGGLRK